MNIFTKEIINHRYQTILKGGEKIRLGVAVTLINNQGEVLLERRSDCGWWGITGGSLEIGETVEECAIREIKEECDIKISKNSLNLVNIYSNPKQGRVVQYPDNRIHLIDIIYFSKTNETVFKTSEESLELKFFKFENLPKYLIPPSIHPLKDISKLI
tara:strand:+ start:24 stop:497 length:474 start_codon:yes stop_codon:yes gene_type:complete